MDLSVKYTFLEVDDHESALAFYRDVLGLEVRQDVAMEGARWLTVGSASQPEFGIVLQTAGVGRPAEDARRLRELLAKGSFGLVMETDNVDATFEAVQASGAEVLQEPMDQPYGTGGATRDCAFRDPSGNQVRIIQRTKG
jgi:predicted enzyme related to lactoylglutathione lyase